MNVGKTISRVKLEGDGWYFIFNYGTYSKVFAKENQRIIWDTIKQEVVIIYTI
jgi:hypothetical protein